LNTGASADGLLPWVWAAQMVRVWARSRTRIHAGQFARMAGIIKPEHNW